MSDLTIEFKRNARQLTEIAENRLIDGSVYGSASAYREALELEPFNYDANVGFANLCFDIGEYSLGMEHWYRALCVARTADDIATVYNGIGAGFHFMHNDDMAALYFFSQMRLCDSTGLECEYDDVMDEVRESCRQALDEREQDKAPFRLINAGEEVDEEYCLDLMDEAKELFDKGMVADAIKKYLSVPEGSEHYFTACENAASLYSVMNKPSEAYAVSNVVLATGYDSFVARYVRCWACLKLDKKEEAAADFEQLGDRWAEKYIDYHYRMITLYMLAQDDESALKHAKLALSNAPYDLNALFYYGTLEYNAGNMEECIAAFKKVLAFTDNLALREGVRLASLPEGERPERLGFKIGATFREAEMPFLVDVLSKKMKKNELFCGENAAENTALMLRAGFADLLCGIVSRGIDKDGEKYLDYLRTVFASCGVPDKNKQEMLAVLLKKGVEATVECVVSFGIKKLELKPLRIDGRNAEDFIGAHATVVSYMMIGNDGYIDEFTERWLAVYERVKDKDISPLTEDEVTVAALTVLNNSPVSSVDDLDVSVAEMCDVDLEQTLAILEIKEEDCMEHEDN